MSCNFHGVKMNQNISIIVAYDENRAIGRENSIPWQLPADLQHFKSLTMGKTIIMGRNTFASLNYRLLPGRTSVVITSDPESIIKYGAEVYTSLDEALAAHASEQEIMIIGGGLLYRSSLSLAYKIYATEVDVRIEDADTYFPELPENFRKVSEERHNADDKNQYVFDYVLYERVNGGND